MKIGKILSSNIIFAQLGMFNCNGLAKELISNNKSQLTSDELKCLRLHCGIKHSLTAPYHLQSNGLSGNTEELGEGRDRDLQATKVPTVQLGYS